MSTGFVVSFCGMDTSFIDRSVKPLIVANIKTAKIILNNNAIGD